MFQDVLPGVRWLSAANSAKEGSDQGSEDPSYGPGKGGKVDKSDQFDANNFRITTSTASSALTVASYSAPAPRGESPGLEQETESSVTSKFLKVSLRLSDGNCTVGNKNVTDMINNLLLSRCYRRRQSESESESD